MSAQEEPQTKDPVQETPDSPDASDKETVSRQTFYLHILNTPYIKLVMYTYMYLSPYRKPSKMLSIPLL